MNVLICSILRNQENDIETWYNQISNIVKEHPDIGFYLSVYENDSTDNTKEKLLKLDYSIFKDYSLQMVNSDVKPEYYSGKYDKNSKERIELLVDCRNKALFGKDLYKDSDYILFVESNIKYETYIFKELLKFIIDSKCDIVTVKSDPINDDHYERTTRLKKGDLSATTKSDSINFSVHATFNCMALYNSEPIKNGIKFTSYSDILDDYDCETVIMCENFRKAGYNKIFILPFLKINHS